VPPAVYFATPAERNPSPAVSLELARHGRHLHACQRRNVGNPEMIAVTFMPLRLSLRHCTVTVVSLVLVEGCAVWALSDRTAPRRRPGSDITLPQPALLESVVECATGGLGVTASNGTARCRTTTADSVPDVPPMTKVP
jgi:hypothetical protein